ncbi:hypothetical protein [Priestia taiwanensis]|uniref:Uncharacterized protein n=1 Tax=Priestia taiwanensis TaxID=1347902 RepID=A0A917ELN7_9BACI|nr:hypothetical protein [Priestia taiwanensis]MBM7362257.1 hypothetical protein [Priestia taiwanensis]GGE60694.1 hypothetical protein GCM10007140_08780 [Priestia taiwanensis]
MKRQTTFVILIITCLIVVVFVMKKTKENSVHAYLKGTYTSKQLPFNSFVFDTEDNYTFYYYHYDEFLHTQTVEKGTFSKASEDSFILESEYFDGKGIYPNKNNGFSIIINNKEYNFTRISRIPIFIKWNE